VVRFLLDLKLVDSTTIIGMAYHSIHHLYPAIPLTKNAAAFREKAVLEARGCRFEHL
jgi:beta-carotene hydroxylase